MNKTASKEDNECFNVQSDMKTKVFYTFESLMDSLIDYKHNTIEENLEWFDVQAEWAIIEELSKRLIYKQIKRKDLIKQFKERVI